MNNYCAGLINTDTLSQPFVTKKYQTFSPALYIQFNAKYEHL